MARAHPPIMRRFPLVCCLLLTSACLGKIGGAGGGRDGDASVQPQVKTAPIARLTNKAYANALRDLFPGFTLPPASLPADVVVGNFNNNSAAQAPAAALLDVYSNNSEAIANVVTTDLPKLTGCARATTECSRAWALDFARRAYRRPLEQTQRERLTALFTSGSDDVEGLGLVIQGVLQSPAFLYRPEIGGTVDAGKTPLDGYELASRLSFFLWDSIPDEELYSAAADGSLDTIAGIDTQTRRMLESTKAREQIANFQGQWLRFDKLGGLVRDGNMFPTFDAATGAALAEGVTKYVDKLFWEDGSLETLLTDNHAFVNNALASIYGVTSPQDELVWTELDAARRSGILTQAGVLAAFAHPTVTSPVLRGQFVLERFLCSPTPPAPPGVVTATPPIDPSKPMTNRQRIEQQHESGPCAGCHKVIDGVGFGFEHYDAVGQWRDTEMGFPIDASGSLVSSKDINGPFYGAVELGQKLARSEGVRECVASKWVEFALGMPESLIDEVSIAELATGFEGNRFDMRELVVAVTTSETFRYRTPVTEN